MGAHLIGAARVEERDQDVGEHIAGEQDATVGEQDRGVADGVRLVLDDLARHRSPVRGQWGEEPDQLERDARRAVRRHPLRPLPGSTGRLGARRGGVARPVAEPGVPEQVVPARMGGEPRDHRNAEPVHVIGELVRIGTVESHLAQPMTRTVPTDASPTVAANRTRPVRAARRTTSAPAGRSAPPGPGAAATGAGRV